MQNTDMNVCKHCDNFLGGGDWNLCCKNPPESQASWCGFLCYEDTPACENYIPLKHLRLRKSDVNWDTKEFPLHTGWHSQ